MRKVSILGLLILTAVMIAAGCTVGNTSAKSDETVCVFDGSENGSQKLKYQLLPGQEPKDHDNNDEVVRIPTSNRFYAAFRDRSKADAGSPQFYRGFAQGNVQTEVEGQAKFRFLTDNACEWYVKHGRRNAIDGKLGFNARSDEAASDFSPWVRWLNENFGTVMAATIKSESLDYTWPELVYGNDAEAPKRSQPVDISYGKHIGFEFTKRLEQSIGGKFFCGTDPSIWDGYEIDNTCPPIFFETGPILTTNKELMAQREKTESLRAEADNADQEARIRQRELRSELNNDAIEARIRAQKVGSQRRDEKTKQKVLVEQVKTAKLEALADVKVQKCLLLAKQGLDCDGRRPTVVVGALPSSQG